MRLTSVPTASRSRATGVICSRHRAERRHRRLQLLAGTSGTARSSSPGPRAPRRSPGRRCSPARSALETSLRFFAHSASTRSPDRAPSASRRVLVGQDRQHLVELAQRRVRAADHLAQVLAAPREPGAELVQDDREALAVRDGASRLRIRSSPTGVTGLLDRQQALAGAVLALRDLAAAAAAAARPPAAAVSAGTRRASRRSPTGGGSGTRRPRGSPGSPASSIFRITAARRSSVTSRPSIAPTFAPAIITSCAGDRERGVVEDRADLVVAAVVLARRPRPTTSATISADDCKRRSASRCLTVRPASSLRVAVLGAELAVVGERVGAVRRRLRGRARAEARCRRAVHG